MFELLCVVFLGVFCWSVAEACWTSGLGLYLRGALHYWGRAALPVTWRADLRRALGTLVGQLPTLFFFYPLVWREGLSPTLCALILAPALIALVSRFLPGDAGVLFAGGVGALATLPHAVLSPSWDFATCALVAVGALAGLLVLAAVRWRPGLLSLGLVVALGLLLVGILGDFDWCIRYVSVLIAAVGAGSGARLLDRLPELRIARAPVDLAATTRLSRTLRRSLPAVLAVLPLAGVAAAIPASFQERVTWGGASALFALAPALVAWAADEESSLRGALVGSVLGAVALGAFALLQGQAWGALAGGGEAIASLAVTLELVVERKGPFLTFLGTFASSAGILTLARFKGREPVVVLIPACLLGGILIARAACEGGDPSYSWVQQSEYRWIPLVVSFSWLLSLGGFELGDRWLSRTPGSRAWVRPVN